MLNGIQNFKYRWGGARGVIPLALLAELEKQSGIQTADRFDLISGTSTGGLIACGLTLKENGKSKYKYSALTLLNLYKKHIPLIFQHKHKNQYIREGISYFRPSYNTTGLDSALNSILGTFRLNSCRKPIFVSCYDMRNRFPIYFTSRHIVQGHMDFDKDKNFYLSEICRATSAAPTYFPPFKLEYPGLAGNQSLATHCIDGGIFVNNPSLAAYIEVIQHKSHPLYEKALNEPIKVLSLGTGAINSTTRSEKNMENAGKTSWARPVIEIMMQANAQIVEEHMKVLLSEENFLRIDPSLQAFPEMDDSSTDAINFWIDEVSNKKVINNAPTWNLIKKF